MGRRTRDAEAELNLPPGFRFHPTDEELVVHYLCRKVAYQCLPVPIIAEVDLYKYDPWELPEKAMFGQKEWYFFTPRDRKYPNGSRPNRAAGRGYWKATGADKPVSANGTGRPIGIKKALVFYSGKAPKGIKTDWIMHEYRLADTTRSSANKKGTLRLDEWVLCRLYNKKNNWEKLQQQKEPTNSSESVSDSFRTMPESDVEDDMINDSGNMGLKPLQLSQDFKVEQQENNAELKPLQLSLDFKVEQQENNEWFMDLSLDDLQNSFFGSAVWPPALEPAPNQDYFYFQTNLSSPQLRRTDPPHF